MFIGFLVWACLLVLAAASFLLAMGITGLLIAHAFAMKHLARGAGTTGASSAAAPAVIAIAAAIALSLALSYVWFDAAPLARSSAG